MKNATPIIIAALLTLVLPACQDINVQTETVDEPSFDLAAGPYNATQTVHITHTDPAVTIMYATGSGKTTADAQTALNTSTFTAYTSGANIICSDVVTLIKAYAKKPGLRNSSVVNARYAVVWEDVTPSGLLKRTDPALTVKDSIIYIVGGYESDFSNKVELFTPSTGDLNAGNPLVTARNFPGATTIGSMVFVFGGCDGSGPLFTSEASIATSPFWESKAAMPSAHYAFGYGTIGDDLYIAGGTGGGTLPKNAFSRYSLVSNSWITDTNNLGTLPPMTTGRTMLTMVAFDNELYAIGGDTGTAKTGVVEKYSPTSNIWTSLASLSVPRSNLCSCVAANALYVFGGRTGGDGTDQALVERYDALKNQWITTTAMPYIFLNIRCAAVNDTVYIYGKTGSATSDPNYIFAYHAAEDH